MAGADDTPGAALAGLYDRPVLVLDPGMHTAPIRRIAVDAGERYLATASLDKTVRVWSLDDGRLLRTLRVPTGAGNVGQLRAVALSPDGSTVAAAGWTTQTGLGSENIYLFDRASGRLERRISGLPNVVYHLAYSEDGRHLAAALWGANGVRVYRAGDGDEVFAGRDYGDSSWWTAFDRSGRLVTTSWDGHVRLYDRDFRLIAKERAPGGEDPFAAAFSPDGRRIAVGSYDSPRVDVLSGETLKPLFAPDTAGVDNGNLMMVAWSADGRFLYAGGRYQNSGRSFVRRWDDAGRGEAAEFLVSTNTIMGLLPLTGCGLAFGAADPALGVLDAAGRVLWERRPDIADFRGPEGVLAVSADGAAVRFGYELFGRRPARFSVAERRLDTEPPADTRLAPARTETPGLTITGWNNTDAPELNSQPLALWPYETSRSLAIAPDGQRFLLGADWSLRLFDREGGERWRVQAPGVAWAVNVSGDGRLAVAAFADGTIRWHRMDDGRELLALLPLADRANWVAWTPDGFYAATPGAHGVLRWHVNRGWDAPAEAIPVSDIAELRRPEVLPLVLQEMDIVQALGLAELAKARRAVQVRTNSAVKPGAQLHVLAIGVGEYNEATARHLRLAFADKDAHDVAAALLNTQGSLYARVNPQVLRNGEATRAGMFRALAILRGQMRPEFDDLAVIHFSGHGALVDGALYLLPHEVDARDAVGIKASAIGIGDLRAELHRLAERGRVLVLLDACRSGAATLGGDAMVMDSALLRTALATTNVSVLTSSSGSEPSREDPRWNNGAFTEVFLEALSEADTDRNGVISMTGLTHYLTTHVPRLTEGRQMPGIEVRFQRTIFAAGL